MFLISVTAKRLCLFGAAALLFLGATIGGVYLVSQHDSVPVSTPGGIQLHAQDESQIQTFFSDCGISIDPASVEVKEVILPDPLDDIYSEYNKLQMQQGFDLTKYCGQRVKSRSYAVTDGPDIDPADVWRANILVWHGKIIAADLAQTALDGSMRPLIPG